MYAEGYLMGKEAAADGHKTALLLGGNVGDAHLRCVSRASPSPS